MSPLNGALALLDHDLLELSDHGLDLLEVGIHGEGALEVAEGLLRLVQLQVDLPVAGQRPPVLRVALDHLVAVLQRLVVVADQEVDGRALVPALRELGLEPDDLAEGGDGRLALALVHLLHPHREERVHLRVARPAPHLPDRVLGERADEVVRILQHPEERGKIGGAGQLAQPRRGQTARLHVGRAEVAQCFFTREPRLALGVCPSGREKAQAEDRGHEQGSHAVSLIMARNCASSSVVTPRRFASSALDPASSPTTTKSVFFDTAPVTRPPRRRMASLAWSRLSNLRPPVRTSVLPVSGPGVSETPFSVRSRPTSRRCWMVFRFRSSWAKRAVDSAILRPMPGISLICSTLADSSRSMLPKRAARSWAARSPIIRMPSPFRTRESPRLFDARTASTRFVADFLAMRSSLATASTSSS